VWRSFRTSNAGLWTVTVAGGLLLLVVGVGFTYLLDSQQRIRARSELAARTSGAAQAIERQLTKSLSATGMLGVLVRQGGGRVTDFGEIAQEIVRQLSGISTLALAPGGVVRDVYPPDSTEVTPGENVLSDPARRESTLAAIRTHSTTLSGPLAVSGRNALMIERQPVYLRSAAAGKERFWGFAIVVVNLPELLESAHLTQTLGAGTAFRLSRAGVTPGELAEILDSSETPLAQPVRSSIVVPGGQWTLAAAPTRGWGDMRERIEFWSMLVAVAIGTTMFHLLLRQQQRIAELALYDPLTGLANRAYLHERATLALNHARRSGRHVAVLFVDLDGFKLINDRHGHSAGDLMLREIAMRLQAHVRTVDTVGRVGGDEFVVVLGGLMNRTEHERVRAKLEDVLRRPHVIEGKKLKVGVSLGASVYPDHGETLDELIVQADRSMYRTKRGGAGPKRLDG
jgi:diguanylate cyclase (GGDEF)-like protein